MITVTGRLPNDRRLRVSLITVERGNKNHNLTTSDVSIPARMPPAGFLCFEIGIATLRVAIPISKLGYNVIEKATN